MHCQLDDTIAAIATAQGGAARAIIRLAGPRVAECLADCFVAGAGLGLGEVRSSQVIEGQIEAAELQRLVPCDLYYWPDHRSFTKSPLAELHLLGSPPLAAAVLRTLCDHGARLARPGEFTLRAFLAGRIDLTEAEAILGVIDANSEQDFDVALRQLAGGLSGPLNLLRNTLLDLLAHVEAGLDFVEEDIQFIDEQQLMSQLSQAHIEVREIAARMQRRTVTTDAMRVVLCGSPNVGKSSLFNRLAGRDHALVSALPGTTRDYVSAHIDLEGVACELIDTAGTEYVTDKNTVSAAAQKVTEDQHEHAHIRLLCLDASRPLEPVERRQAINSARGELVVMTKCDAVVSEAAQIVGDRADLPAAIRTSSRDGRGIDELRRAIGALAAQSDPAPGGVVSATANRCRDSLARTTVALQQAINALTDRRGEEIVAAELRAALDELGHVVGTVYTDDLLDRIFSQFCIGK